MFTLYDYLPSQNAYKVRLLLSHLDIKYETQIVSIFEGEGQNPDYLAVNPTGAVPALRLDDGRVIAESMAILWFLAEGTAYLPDDSYSQAKILQWLSFENDYLQNSIGSLRFWTLTGKVEGRPIEMVEAKRKIALKVLNILERELTAREFLVDGGYTIADIACFAYAHLAEDGSLSLQPYPNLLKWLDRVRTQLGFLPTIYPYSVDPHAGNELP